MTQVDEIKSAIQKLSDEELGGLKDWLAELDAQRFDARIERDLASGKLDKLIERARANRAAGNSWEI